MLELNDRRTAALVFVSLFVTYAWFFGGSGFGQNATFSQARAIVERHTLSIDSYLGNTADLSHYGGHTYPNKAPGLSVLTAIPYAFVHAVTGPPRDALHLTLVHYLCTVAVCGTSGAAIGALLFLMLRSAGITRRRAAGMALAAGLGTPLFAYSTMLFLHVPSAFFMLLAIAAAAELIDVPAWVAGLAIGAATCINYLSVFAIVAIVLLYGMTRRENARRNLALFVAGGVPFALLLAAYHFVAFGSPFRTAFASTNPAFLTKGALLGIFVGPRLEALWGVTFSPYRGLFFMSPFLLLGAYAVIAARRQIAMRPIVVASAIVFALLLLFNISFNGWHGGYAIGARYMLPAVPLLALLAGLGSATRRLTIALVAISIVMNLAAAAVDPQPPDQLRDPFGRYLLPSLFTGKALQGDASVPVWIRDYYTGHTSTNRVASDEMLPFQRHAPGSPESEWASFNLGEIIFGPGSAASLLPLALLWLGFAALLMRATRTESADA